MKKSYRIPRETKKYYTSPVSSRLMAALFSILRPYIHAKTTFLDLYAGTGQVGIEALKQGAKFTTFVDASEEAFYTIEENVKAAGVQVKTYIAEAKAEDFLSHNIITSGNLESLTQLPETYDIIFADPPYQKTDEHKYYDIINLAKGFMPDGGILVIKHPAEIQLEAQGEDLILADERKYGINRLTFFVTPVRA